MSDNSGCRWQFKDFDLNLDRASLSRDGELISVRPKSFEVLVVLVENAGRVVLKDQILRAVWHDVIVTEDSLVRCVHEVRQALGDTDQKIVKTIPRRGYLFDIPVILLDATEISDAADQSHEVGPRQQDHRLTRPAWFGAFAMAVAALAAFLWLASGNQDGPVSHPLPQPFSVAVNEFKDLTGDGGSEQAGRRLSEDVLTNLAMFTDLKVVTRELEPPIGKFLPGPHPAKTRRDTRYLLAGSVTGSPPEWNATVRLVDTATYEQIWSQRYRAQSDSARRTISMFAREIASNVASKISYLGAQQLSRERVSNLTADELVLRARLVSFRSASLKSTSEARNLAQRAIALDVSNAAAYVELGRTFYRAFVLQWEGPEALWKAEAAAKQAVRIEQNSPSALELLARVYLRRRQHGAAIAILTKAIRLNPNRAATYASLADAMTFAGRALDAVSNIEAAIRLDQNYPPRIDMYLGRALYFTGQYEPAAVALDACIARAPGFRPCYIYSAAVHAELGRREEAQRSLTKLLELSPDFSIEQSVQRHLPYLRNPMQKFTSSLVKAGAPR